MLTAAPEAPLHAPSSSALAWGSEEFGRAAIDSVLNRRGLALSLEVESESDAIAISARLESFLLTVAGFSAGSFVRIAPTLIGETFPAMLALTKCLGHRWRVEGERTVLVGDARLVFVSADRPVRESRAVDTRPDRLAEVVSAHRIDRRWYRSRVVPRLGADGLTRLFYGLSGTGDSLFADVRRANLAAGRRDGVPRHFTMRPTAESGSTLSQASPPLNLAALPAAS